jgi:Family of unknown function (DUF6962)
MDHAPTLTEPMTMVTDYLLALLCLGIVIALGRRSALRGGRRVGLWLLAFAVLALAAIAGGTAHGFRNPLGESWARVWRVTVWSIAAGSALLVAAGVRSVRRSQASSESARRRGISWLERAIAVSLLGLVVLVGRIAPHESFNQNDLYHVIQMVGLYCLYRGAALLHGLDEPTRVGDSGGRAVPRERGIG